MSVEWKEVMSDSNKNIQVATLLTMIIIALLLIAITFKLYNQPASPTYGDYMALKYIGDAEKIKEKKLNLMRDTPMVRVQGGNIDAEVTGSVDVEGSVSIDNWQ